MIRFRVGGRVYASSHPKTRDDCLHMLKKAKRFLLIDDNTDEMKILLWSYNCENRSTNQSLYQNT